jgi:poly-beta-1,6-N-acetyl-D-glucosamine biosynthesis protein PgaD
MWGVLLEHGLSLVWAHLMALTVVLWLLGLWLPMPEAIRVSTLLPEWYGVILGFTCLLQFAVSLAIDGRYEGGMGRYYYWMVWYPIAFWVINMVTTVAAVPKAIAQTARHARGLGEPGSRAEGLLMIPPTSAMPAPPSPAPGSSALDPALGGPVLPDRRGLIIERPDLQPRRERVIYGTITAVAWVLWAYLWLPLVTLVAWYFGVRAFIREVVIPDRVTLLATGASYLLVIVVLGGALLVWSRYNLRRFGGEDRREASAPLGGEEIRAWFSIPRRHPRVHAGRGERGGGAWSTGGGHRGSPQRWRLTLPGPSSGLVGPTRCRLRRRACQRNPLIMSRSADFPGQSTWYGRSTSGASTVSSSSCMSGPSGAR